jgi:predicted RNase H-like HicB family nuclease
VATGATREEAEKNMYEAIEMHIAVAEKSIVGQTAR